MRYFEIVFSQIFPYIFDQCFTNILYIMSRLFIERKNTNKNITFYLDRMIKVNVHFTLNSNEISTQVFSPVWHQIWR